ncbi:MAG: NAD(P)H-dependent oxidoreductase [Anaerocolumna sp.]
MKLVSHFYIVAVPQAGLRYAMGINMHVFIIYCHPSDDSFTYNVKTEFIKGLQKASHTWVISDLYKMNFNTEFMEKDYLREAYYQRDPAIADDVLQEQRKIQEADAIVFIYPVFWTEAPAKLIGWFDRVWTYGFAYGENIEMKLLNKALVLATTGRSIHNLIQSDQAQAMETVMLGDRINYRAKEKQIVFLDGMSREDKFNSREKNWEKHLEKVYQLGSNF